MEERGMVIQMVKKAGITKERVVEAVFKAVDEVNQLVPKEQRIDKDLQVELVGTSGKLDSLGLVNLIVGSEQKIEEEFGIAISLADAIVMSQNHGPFKTVGSLADYVLRLLEECQSE